MNSSISDYFSIEMPGCGCKCLCNFHKRDFSIKSKFDVFLIEDLAWEPFLCIFCGLLTIINSSKYCLNDFVFLFKTYYWELADKKEWAIENLMSVYCCNKWSQLSTLHDIGIWTNPFLLITNLLNFVLCICLRHQIKINYWNMFEKAVLRFQ